MSKIYRKEVKSMLSEKMELKEAIEWFKEHGNCSKPEKKYDQKQEQKATKTALSAMETLRMYEEGGLCLIPNRVHAKQCDELDAYKECGSLEAVRGAVAKQNAEAIEVWNGQACCPYCKKLFGNMIDITSLKSWDMPHCKWCGQKLDWKVAKE